MGASLQAREQQVRGPEAGGEGGTSVTESAQTLRGPESRPCPPKPHGVGSTWAGAQSGPGASRKGRKTQAGERRSMRIAGSGLGAAGTFLVWVTGRTWPGPIHPPR